MRAIAILWVIIFHNSTLPYLNTFFMQCVLPNAPYLLFITNGDMGVDMFFVLSGFLIGYMLLKELNKYGSIDYKHFILSRFLRIWPALLFYQTIIAAAQISDPWW
jgi:peptidoglycan/LPS O-acetylase OafA/YrhL